MYGYVRDGYGPNKRHILLNNKNDLFELARPEMGLANIWEILPR